MKKILVSYWSGTGNTEKMAQLICDGAKADNIEVILKNVGNTTVKDIEEADGIALGCPSMGDEVLEEYEMEPFVNSIQAAVSGKPSILFGSYGWGDGKWMRDWYERMENYGAKLVVEEGLIVNGEPAGVDMDQCTELGKALKNSIL